MKVSGFPLPDVKKSVRKVMHFSHFGAAKIAEASGACFGLGYFFDVKTHQR